MKKQSAGILLFRIKDFNIQVFLVHPGGPFWMNRDEGAWTIPKGEFTDDEKALDVAIREFKEETGVKISGKFIELSPVKQKSGKTVYAWAIEGELDSLTLKCETCINIEWPPKSGKVQSFPEIDKGEWFSANEAKQKINSSQAPLIDELIEKLIV